MRGTTSFKKDDVKRLLQAVEASGNPIAGVEFDIQNKRITVMTGSPTEPTVPKAGEAKPANEWDNAV